MNGMFKFEIKPVLLFWFEKGKMINFSGKHHLNK